MAQISNKTWMAFLVGAVALVCFMNYQQATSTPVERQHNNCNKPASSEAEEVVAADNGQPWDDGLLMLPHVAECADDEQNRPGAHPSCEPTCANPDPVCIKIWYQQIDYVPCFCKAPLVRNTETKKCVPRSECPAKSQKV